MHPAQPLHGVRYEFTLRESSDASARYDVEVFTADRSARVVVEIDRAGSRCLDESPALDPAHLTQLLAIARTLGRRDESPWPRRIQRWRAPGVR